MPKPRLAPGRFLAPGAGAAAGSAGFTSSADGVFRNILSPQTIGVDPLHAGICRFHLMFFSVLHVSGRFFASGAVPFPLGPRQLGQFDASATDAIKSGESAKRQVRWRIRRLATGETVRETSIRGEVGVMRKKCGASEDGLGTKLAARDGVRGRNQARRLHKKSDTANTVSRRLLILRARLNSPAGEGL